MEERSKQLTTDAAGENLPAADPDKTLVLPRFDVREERTAQPVVPLAPPPVRGGRRFGGSLPLMIILVSAVVGGLVSVLAYRAYQRQPAAQEARQQPQPTPSEEAAADVSPTPELIVVAAAAQPEPQPQPQETSDNNDAETATPAPAVTAGREERAAVKEMPKPEAAAERAPRRANDGARPERAGETARTRRVEVITGPVGERVSRRERASDDSEIEGEATDYDAPAEQRARRRAARRAGRRNVDRVRAIFEGDPPQLD